MKKLAFVSAFLLVVSFAGGAQAFTVTTYNNYTSFIDAVLSAGSSPVLENFEDAILQPGFSISEIGGAGVIQYGVYKNTVDKDIPRYQLFNYASGMIGFGGWFDLKNPGGPGTGINMYIDDDGTFVMSIPTTAAGEFYGFLVHFLTEGSFTSVRLEDAGIGTAVQETYYAVDVAFVPYTVIPIPAAAWLLGSGLLGLAVIRRRVRS
ncbi:MAG: VPLPA-CTERM sorting domain-containing protein [Syntrophales bacterium]|jgi:hypothetical protein